MSENEHVCNRPTCPLSDVDIRIIHMLSATDWVRMPKWAIGALVTVLLLLGGSTVTNMVTMSRLGANQIHLTAMLEKLNDRLDTHIEKTAMAKRYGGGSAM